MGFSLFEVLVEEVIGMGERERERDGTECMHGFSFMKVEAA